MRIRLYDVTRITRTGLVPHSAIDAEDGAITAVYDTLPAEEPGVRSVDAKGAYAAPGFIDIHLHGGGGVEFMDATPERIRAGCAAHARHGTTTLLPTTLAASPELTLRMIRAVRQAQAATTECTIAGVHLEGRSFRPRKAGLKARTRCPCPRRGCGTGCWTNGPAACVSWAQRPSCPAQWPWARRCGPRRRGEHCSFGR